jgi:hypothetical protein
MRRLLQDYGAIVLILFESSAAPGCSRARPVARVVDSRPAEAEQGPSTFDKDPEWSKRVVVVSVDPGNAVTARRSESRFSTRTSRASVDSHTSSMLVQVAALSHIGSIKKPLVEQQLREMGLDVVAMKRSKLRQPNAFNVLVEDITYVEEVERKNSWDPVVFTLTPAIHVRVITANERNTFEASPITVRSYGPLSSQVAETYGRQLALARIELGKRLVEWLGGRLSLPSPNTAASTTNATPPASKPVPRSARGRLIGVGQGAASL